MTLKRATTRQTKRSTVTPARSGKRAAKKAALPKSKPTLHDVVLAALADMKAVDVKALDVRGIIDIRPRNHWKQLSDQNTSFHSQRRKIRKRCM